MAQGLAVLDAALAGKRVRFRRETFGAWSDWLDIDELKLRRIHFLWDRDWDIEELPMTLTEALVAMDAGQTAEHGEVEIFPGAPVLIQWRQREHVYEFRTLVMIRGSEWSSWERGHFTKRDIDATDWHVVEDKPQERPTPREAMDCLMEQVRFNVHDLVYALQSRWPAMFRET